MVKKTIAHRRNSQKAQQKGRIGIWLMEGSLAAAISFLMIFACLNYTAKRLPEKGVGAKGEASSDISETALQGGEEDVLWSLRLVNRWNPIPEGYTVDLKELPGGEQVDERIYEPLLEMLEAAREGNWGEVPRVISGYRTQETQQALYEEEVARYQAEGWGLEEAKEKAGKWVAVPGTSEHQLGLAVDLEGATYDVFSWLQENSYQYGFIFRYPSEKTELTGTVEEVWHYRYVGVEAAAEIYERGICLEEYLTEKNGEMY